MPKPVSQKPGGPKPTTRPQTQTTKSKRKGMKINVYGRGKTGKTRLFNTFPGRKLLVGTEDGTNSICTDMRSLCTLDSGLVLWELLAIGKPTGTHFAKVERPDQIEELIALAGSGDYDHLCLDHGSGLQDLVLTEVLGLAELPVERTFGMATRDHWMACGAQTKEFLHRMLTLADTVGIDVFVIAHERNFGDDGEASDLITPTISSSLTPKVALWLDGRCDYICQTFIRMAEETKVTKIDGKPVTTKVKTGKAEYCLRIGPHPVYRTGFRVPDFVQLPDVIVNPTYDKIVKLIKGV